MKPVDLDMFRVAFFFECMCSISQQCVCVCVILLCFSGRTAHNDSSALEFTRSSSSCPDQLLSQTLTTTERERERERERY